MLYSKYNAMGLCVFPLAKGVMWSQYQDTLPSAETALEWDNKSFTDYKLCTGKVSGVIALDIDDDSIVAMVESCLGFIPKVRKFGTKGYTAFFKHNGEKSDCWKQDGKVVLELLSDKRNTTIPPSVHRVTGKQYIWLEGELGDDLPFLPTYFIKMMDSRFNKIERVQRESFNFDAITMQQAGDALGYIDANCNRDDWLKVCFALRDEFGDAANELWHSWSSGGASYKISDAQAVWRSANGNGIGIGTLIHLAKQGGYITQSTVIETPKTPKTPKVYSLDCHGDVKELADWLTRTAWRPQPLLALNASIAFIGFLKGRNFVTECGKYSNIYSLNIAGTASGKERIITGLKFLIQRLGIEDKLMNKSASGAGFIDGLAKVDGHGISIIDELGDYIGSGAGSNSGYFRKIFTMWLDTFTSQSTFIDGEGRADSAKQPAKRIHNPFFNLIGFTNARSLQSVLTGDSLSNGFLNRFLFAESKETPRKRKARDFNQKEMFSEEITQRFLRYIEAEGEEIVIKYTDEAYALYDNLEEFYEDTLHSIDDNDQLKSLYGRCGEMVGKVALIVCNNRKIELHDVQFAAAFVKNSVATAISFCDGISETNEQKEFNKIKSIIKKSGEISYTKLNNLLKGAILARRRKEILDDMASTGVIEITQVETHGRFVNMIKYTQQP
jgi:Primase C terminal 2 (PriCT-2)/Protein of unknown function (DUF3987)/Bifunctional DNA primase/polymerase, N-terminal